MCNGNATPDNGTRPLLGNSAWIGEEEDEKGLRKKRVKEIKIRKKHE
jgi:hypothetical protein